MITDREILRQILANQETILEALCALGLAQSIHGLNQRTAKIIISDMPCRIGETRSVIKGLENA